MYSVMVSVERKLSAAVLSVGGFHLDDVGSLESANLFEPDDLDELDLETNDDPVNVDLKTTLISPTDTEYESLLGRLRERLNENQLETIFTVGTGGE